MVERFNDLEDRWLQMTQVEEERIERKEGWTDRQKDSARTI